MQINLRQYGEKSFKFRVLIILCLILCGIVINEIVKTNNNNTPEYKGQSTNSSFPRNKIVLPTLVIACDTKFLDRIMDSLSNFRPDSTTFPVIVAVYCNHKANNNVLKSYEWDPTINVFEIPTSEDAGPPSRVGQNYKFALNYVFKKLEYQAVIILEDNLDISPDFFEYFLGTYPLLKKDPSIWCVSAWNDNCIHGLVESSQHNLLHRTDFFPGKGWMLLSETWQGIEMYLGDDLFEEYLYNPVLVRGRVCIRPEISRTYMFGAYNSKNLTELPKGYAQKDIRLLNTVFVPFTQLNLSYLLKANEHLFLASVFSCPVTTAEDLKTGSISSSSKSVRIPYANITMFKRVANMFGISDDFRYGVPSTGLYGIVQCFINSRRVFLTHT